METLCDDILLALLHAVGGGRLPILPDASLTVEKLGEQSAAFYAQLLLPPNPDPHTGRERVIAARHIYVDVRKWLRRVRQFAHTCKRFRALLQPRWRWIYTDLHALFVTLVGVSRAKQVTPPPLAPDRWYEIQVFSYARTSTERDHDVDNIGHVMFAPMEGGMFRVENAQSPAWEALRLPAMAEITSDDLTALAHMLYESEPANIPTKLHDTLTLRQNAEEPSKFYLVYMRALTKPLPTHRPFGHYISRVECRDALLIRRWGQELRAIEADCVCLEKKRKLDELREAEEALCKKARRF